jgi:endonuclease/exonuclease/phosphatase family metal-dependent hydrolase
VARLDRIMVTPGLGIDECGVHHSATARKASDHYPVWAKLRRT